MIDYDCSACEQLREDAPNFVVNGMGETEVASLQNNTGLNPSSGNDDCEDLNAMNDCLVKNMETEIDSYNVCSWKDYMKALVGNLWTVNKGIISAICGLWAKVNCVYDGLVNLADAIGHTIGSQAFVRYYRDNSGTGYGYEWDTNAGDSHILDIYMDADLDNAGTQEADKDYVVLIQNCTDIHTTSDTALELTYFSSGDTRPMATIRHRQAQHPTINLNGASTDDFSWTTSGAVLIKEGEHVKVEAYVDVGAGSGAWFRLHQFILTWIPVNISEAIDPGEIIEC